MNNFNANNLVIPSFSELQAQKKKKAAELAAEKNKASPPPPNVSFPFFTPPKTSTISRKAVFAAVKHNSTSTVVSSITIDNPDINLVILSMASAIHFHIVNKTDTKVSSPFQSEFDIFSEAVHPVFQGESDIENEPTVEVISAFLSRVFQEEKLDPEVAIMSLAYIERIIVRGGVVLTPATWRRAVLGATILASKVWEEQSVWNVDYIPIFDGLTAKDLQELERLYLNLLEFNVELGSAEYARYYFNLQSFLTNDPVQISEERAQTIQKRSHEKMKLLSRQFMRKATSSYELTTVM